MAWMAAIPWIVQGAGMLMGGMQGKQDARLLRAQGRIAGQQSIADADAISREYRQLAGRQAAAIAQSGGSYEGSAAKVLHQSESLAYLDRLNVLYHGALRRKGLASEGSAVAGRTSAGTALGLLSLGSSALTQAKTG